MKRGVWILLSMVFCFVLTVAAAEEVPLHKPEEFAVLPWGCTPGDAPTLQAIRECGFNLAGFVAPEHLDAVAAAGLQCIVSDSETHVSDEVAALEQAEIERRVTSLVSRVGNHTAVFGFYLRDEPGANAFPGLGNWAAAFRKASPGKPAYINLFPNYASPAQMNVPTYEEYVESFVTTVQPAFISYDHYALMTGGSLRDGLRLQNNSYDGVQEPYGLERAEVIRGAAAAQPTP